MYLFHMLLHDEALFPTDRGPWTNETGRIKRRKQDCTLPSPQFRWISDWQIDYSLQPGVDNQGWQYAINWPNAFHGTHYHLSDYVRRRRWVRKCRIDSRSLWKEVCYYIKNYELSKKEFS